MIQSHKQQEIDLFKQSLNKQKAHFKNIDDIQIIAEVTSRDEQSSVVKDAGGGGGARKKKSEANLDSLK